MPDRTTRNARPYHQGNHKDVAPGPITRSKSTAAQEGPTVKVKARK